MTQIPENRRVALALLRSVLRQGRPLEEQAEGLTQSLEARDRAFVRRVVATTLRRLGQIDSLLNRYLDRPMAAKLSEVRDILRLGVAQLVFLDAPPHAVVDTSVELVKQGPLVPYKGLVNVLLRRVSRDGKADIAAFDAERLNTPRWLWRDWVATYGEETARRIGAAHLREGTLDVTLCPGEDPFLWADRLNAEILPTGSLRRSGGGTVSDLAGFGEGKWWIQDMAAAIPARLLGSVKGLRVIDLCAAPGGKTMQLAAAGASVTAVDRSARRLRRVRDNMTRLGLCADLVDADATQWRPEVPADAVLLDAPCSATGTIRRHPDVPRLRTQDDVTSLVALQKQLLAASVFLVKSGGLVIYCVCSLQREEGEAQIATALDSGLPFERVPVTEAEVGGLTECITPEGDVRTLPFYCADTGGMDGFFVARLRRL